MLNKNNRLEEDKRFIKIKELKNLQDVRLFSNWVYIDWNLYEIGEKYDSPLNYDNYGFVKYINSKNTFAHVYWEQQEDIIPTCLIKGFYDADS